MSAEDHHMWQVWANFLHHWGVEDLVAWLLEALEPVTLLGAQFLYLGQPLLGTFIPDGHITAMAQLLEEPQNTRAFASYLRRQEYREYQ